MKTKGTLIAAFVLLALGSGARGQFTPGHVFVAEFSAKNCNFPENFGGDRIWEIDPETGEVTLFRELLSGECGSMGGLTFTPDGTRLRASLVLTDQIVEFDSDGNMSVALDADDGISGPSYGNGIAYDANGNFYVVDSGTRILRFPASGGPATVFADGSDGISGGGGIAFAADGDLYYGEAAPPCTILRIARGGTASVFDSLCTKSLTADRTGHLYVGQTTGGIFRYQAGDPDSKELLVDSGGLGFYAMTMSPDQSRIYSVGAGFPFTLVAIDPVDGSVTTLVEITDGETLAASVAGIAVAPAAPPIPAASQWGLVVMTIFLLTVATIVIGDRQRSSRRT